MINQEEDRFEKQLKDCCREYSRVWIDHEEKRSVQLDGYFNSAILLKLAEIAKQIEEKEGMKL